MENSNQTSLKQFILLGLTDIPSLQALCFLIFLIMYIITLSGNSLLVIVVRINSQMQTPMYFFLCNLSVIDICFSSTIVPRIMRNTLAQDKSISVSECAIQMYFQLSLAGTECIILAVMAFDRYAAICKPLQYNKLMNKSLCICLASGTWTVGFISAFIHVYFVFQLPYCRSHKIDHFFCEMPAIFHLSCRDTWINEVAMQATASVIAMCSFIYILLSYILLIFSIIKIRSSEGRRKAFSTCTSHLTVVSIYFGTILFMYMGPQSVYSPERSKIVSVIYTSVTPLLNPIIYSIRNAEVKGSVIKIWNAEISTRSEKKM